MRKLRRISSSVRVSVRMNIKANEVIIAMTRKIKRPTIPHGTIEIDRK